MILLRRALLVIEALARTRAFVARYGGHCIVRCSVGCVSESLRGGTASFGETLNGLSPRGHMSVPVIVGGVSPRTHKIFGLM